MPRYREDHSGPAPDRDAAHPGLTGPSCISPHSWLLCRSKERGGPMTAGAGNQKVKSALVGDLRLPSSAEGDQGEGPDPHERVPMLTELNAHYPGGLAAVSEAFNRVWDNYADQPGGNWPDEARYGSPVLPTVPPGLAVVA